MEYIPSGLALRAGPNNNPTSHSFLSSRFVCWNTKKFSVTIVDIYSSVTRSPPQTTVCMRNNE